MNDLDVDASFYNPIGSDEASLKVFNQALYSMPVQLKIQYGCSNCEWKENGDCFMGFKPGSKTRVKKGICPRRIHFLSGFVMGLEGVFPAVMPSVLKTITGNTSILNNILAILFPCPIIYNYNFISFKT